MPDDTIEVDVLKQRYGKWPLAVECRSVDEGLVELLGALDERYGGALGWLGEQLVARKEELIAEYQAILEASVAAQAAGDKFGQKPICSGPFKFVDRVAQDRIVVEKFADYWNKDNVFIDKIVYLPIVDDTVRLANLRAGGLDLMERVDRKSVV